MNASAGEEVIKMTRKFEIGKGAAGAVIGAAAGATAAVLMSDKKARKAVTSKLNDIKEMGVKAVDYIADSYEEPKLALRNVKGGKSKKIKRK
jgi:gas vesicle protein